MALARSKIGVGAWENMPVNNMLDFVEATKFGWYYAWDATALFDNTNPPPRTVPSFPKSGMKPVSARRFPLPPWTC